MYFEPWYTRKLSIPNFFVDSKEFSVDRPYYCVTNSKQYVLGQNFSYKKTYTTYLVLRCIHICRIRLRLSFFHSCKTSNTGQVDKYCTYKYRSHCYLFENRWGSSFYTSLLNILKKNQSSLSITKLS